MLPEPTFISMPTSVSSTDIRPMRSLTGARQATAWAGAWIDLAGQKTRIHDEVPVGVGGVDLVGPPEPCGGTEDPGGAAIRMQHADAPA